MKKHLITTLCIALTVGVTSLTAADMKGDMDKMMADSSATMKQKMEAIDTYVANVEKNVSSYTRKEEAIAAGSMKSVTDETWSKMHAYMDGTDLKRMKVYPGEGSEKTEEFYYYNNEPVFVFLEKNGKGKENHDKNAKGTKYYFADGKMIGAMDADGKMMEPKDAAAEKMGAKLQKESTAFRGLLK